MMMQDIISRVKSLAENDQSISSADICNWVDDAIQRVNTALKANIPVTAGQANQLTSYIPAFDPRYHECLIVFSVGRYRESDSDYNGANYMMNQFNNMVQLMQRDMIIPPSSRNDGSVQQIVVASASILTYTLVMPYGSYFADFNVYQNDVLVDPQNYTINQWNKSITFTGITLAVNDKITIDYELDSTTNQPPYTWWGQSGW